jgi:hypothetical protein
MSNIPTIVLSAISYGQVYPPYDGTSADFYSDKLRGNGYYGYTDGLHTVSYQLTNFIGVINMQATLASDPTDADWFDIPETIIGDGVAATTLSIYANYTGNFVWCRCAVTQFTAGIINRVLYNT